MPKTRLQRQLRLKRLLLRQLQRQPLQLRLNPLSNSESVTWKPTSTMALASLTRELRKFLAPDLVITPGR